jgi:hypothetical protein
MQSHGQYRTRTILRAQRLLETDERKHFSAIPLFDVEELPAA